MKKFLIISMLGMLSFQPIFSSAAAARAAKAASKISAKALVCGGASAALLGATAATWGTNPLADSSHKALTDHIRATAPVYTPASEKFYLQYFKPVNGEIKAQIVRILCIKGMPEELADSIYMYDDQMPVSGKLKSVLESEYVPAGTETFHDFMQEDSSIAAFYDDKTDKIYIKKSSLAKPDFTLTLLHELQHYIYSKGHDRISKYMPVVGVLSGIIAYCSKPAAPKSSFALALWKSALAGSALLITRLVFGDINIMGEGTDVTTRNEEYRAEVKALQALNCKGCIKTYADDLHKHHEHFCAHHTPSMKLRAYTSKYARGYVAQEPRYVSSFMHTHADMPEACALCKTPASQELR